MEVDAEVAERLKESPITAKLIKFCCFYSFGLSKKLGDTIHPWTFYISNIICRMRMAKKQFKNVQQMTARAGKTACKQEIAAYLNCVEINVDSSGASCQSEMKMFQNCTKRLVC